MNWSALSEPNTWVQVGTIVGTVVAAIKGSMSWAVAIPVILTAASGLVNSFRHATVVAQLRKNGALPPKHI